MDRGGIVGDLRQQRGVGRRVAGAHARRDEHRLALEPSHEVGEEAQRRPVAPLQVVDLEQERALRGEVERQPVEAVQRGEGGVAPGRHAVVRRGEHDARRRRRAPVSTVGSTTTVSNSWRTTPNGKSRSSSPARALSTVAPSVAARRRNSTSRRDLPIPGGPSISTARPSPVDRLLHQRLEPRHLAVALDEPGRRAHAAPRPRRPARRRLVAQQLLVHGDQRGPGRRAELLAQQHADVLVDAQRLVDVAARAQDVHQHGAGGLAVRLRWRRRRARPARPRAGRRRRAACRRRRAPRAPRYAGRPARPGGRRSTAPRARAAGRARRSPPPRGRPPTHAARRRCRARGGRRGPARARPPSRSRRHRAGSASARCGPRARPGRAPCAGGCSGGASSDSYAGGAPLPDHSASASSSRRTGRSRCSAR